MRRFLFYFQKMSLKRPIVNVDDEEIVPKKQKNGGHWSLGLLNSIEDPDCVVQADSLVTVIKDKYPKAEFHYLIIAKENVGSLKSVTTKHSNLLKHMEEVGQKLVVDDEHKGKTFKLGYHAEASMVRLHLHVISDDMNSSSVKTKKHWNSFTTAFFMDSSAVREELEATGKITLPSAEACKTLINTPLKCHKCDYKPKHMPDLKKHIFKH